MGEQITRLRPRRLSLAGAVAAAALMAGPSAALAQEISPTADEYNSTLEVVSQGEGPDAAPSGVPGDGDPPGQPGQPGAPTADETVAGLPFTGLEAGGMLAAAIALAGTGLALRRFTRRGSAETS